MVEAIALVQLCFRLYSQTDSCPKEGYSLFPLDKPCRTTQHQDPHQARFWLPVPIAPAQAILPVGDPEELTLPQRQPQRMQQSARGEIRAEARRQARLRSSQQRIPPLHLEWRRHSAGIALP